MEMTRERNVNIEMTRTWAQTLDALREDPSYRCLYALMCAFGDNVAAELTDEKGELITRSYREYDELSRAAAGVLQKKNPKGFVGLIHDTCMDWPVLLWGILMSGCVPLLMNPAEKPEILSDILKEAKATAYVSAKPLPGSSAEWIPARDMLSGSTPGEERFGEYVALCTSGTTGQSRIFVYDAPTIVNQLLSFQEAKEHNEDMPFVEGTSCKLLAFLPFHHIFGFSVIYLLYACTGKILVYLKDRAATTVLGACRRHGVTHLYCVPMFFKQLAAGIKRQLPNGAAGLTPQQKAGIQSALLGTQIRSMITGGGPISQGVLSLINGIGYPLYNGFGMTECGIISVELSTDPAVRSLGSIGVPFALTECQIRPLGASEGELYIRGGGLYSGTVTDGIITPRDPDAWFGTGDLVRRDETGYYMEGRAKDVIVTSAGENIYPDLLEEAMPALPGVDRSCILGLPGQDGDIVTLILQPAAECDSEKLSGLVEAYNASLPLYQRVSRLLLSENPLPVSGNLKIRRRMLRDSLSRGEWPCKELPLTAAVPVKPACAAASDDILHAVRCAFAQALFIDEESIAPNARFTQELAGDSLSLMSALTALEKQFGILFTDDELRGITTAADTARLIELKLQGKTMTMREEEGRGVARVTDFGKSPEYLALKKRMEDTLPKDVNPYFLPQDSLIRDTSVIRGERVINLGSYNYLGMSGHPETEAAAIEAIRVFGTSASGSRVLAGEKTIYQQLEKTIAEWKHTEDAIACTGGWATNLAFVSSFMTKGDFIVYDALSHNSVTEGAKLSEAETKSFPHNDLKALENILQGIQGRYKKVLIVVEGVYSMDGDIAPIPEFVRLKKQYGCFLMVDEAHSAGVIGDHAGGVDDYFHLDPHDVDIKFGTMSKALGGCGGYIAADHAIVEYLRYNMNGFVFTAGIAPPIAAACMKAIELIQRDNTQAIKLHDNIAYFVRRAKEEGLNTCLAKESAIVPVMVGTDQEAAQLSAQLLGRGVFVPPAMYPAVPKGESRLRFTISSTHSIEQLEKAVTETANLMREHGLIAPKGERAGE